MAQYPELEGAMDVQRETELIAQGYTTTRQAATDVLESASRIRSSVGASTVDTAVDRILANEATREGLIYGGTAPAVGGGTALQTALRYLGIAGSVGGAIYGGLQALGLGEGGGLFGNNLLGGDVLDVGGVELSGPGLPEPSPSQIIKQWTVHYDWGALQYYLVQTGVRSRKILMYNQRTKVWKAWRFNPPHLAVIGKNMPRHQMITRLRRNLRRHRADADTIMKLTSPTYVAYKARKRRRH